MVYAEVISSSSDETEVVHEKKGCDAGWKFWRRKRYIVAVLTFFGFFSVYILRVNLSVAIVSMTETRNITLANGTVVSYREFDWSTELQGYILSSFFYGSIVTQIAGGYLGARLGGAKVFGAGIAGIAALSLITPWLTNANVYFLLAVRVCEGVFEGIAAPCAQEIWSKWAPPLERARLLVITFCGIGIGTVVGMPLSACLINAFGWPSVFYCFGIFGLLWYLIWTVLVTDTPQQDSRISKEELKYITESLNTGYIGRNRRSDIPWKAILTSLPVWAIIASQFSEIWGFFTLMTQLPKFMKRVLNFDLEGAGITSALPYLAMTIMAQLSGYFSDWLQSKGIFTTTQVRKIFNCIGFASQTIFMMSAAFWLSPVGTTFCLTMAVGLGGVASCGFGVNPLDIAPQYASLLSGLGNTIATIPGMVSPILSGYMVTNEYSADEWRVVFYITSGIYLCGGIIFCTFASGELQPWAVDDELLTISQEEKKEDSEIQKEQI